ncbi:MAG TPA: hypothetical protein VFT29_03170 [Gemmatimonadaceae bacterium]|nr:hypothetical protein [Gemmatimonadaceae bacterium]
MCDRRILVLAVLGLTAGCVPGTPSAAPEPETRSEPVSAPAPAAKPPPAIPRSGLDVIGYMRRSHPARDLRSLSFTTRTTRTIKDSTIRARAYASLPGRIRVENYPVSSRTGWVRDRQKLSVFRRGRRVATVNRVDLQTLLAYDIFAQGSDTTVMWLDSARLRYGLVRRDKFEGRAVWVVGAVAYDDTSAQFWVDAERWRLVRVIQRDPLAPGVISDIRIREYTELLDIPVPTRVEVWRAGRLVEVQEMSEFIVNPAIARRNFDLSKWRTSEPGE